MDADNINNLREWAPLTDLLSKIPTRIQKTFFYQDVNITCIDVLSDFIALGSDVGIVFWYNRSTGNVQKLRSEVCGAIDNIVKSLPLTMMFHCCLVHLANNMHQSGFECRIYVGVWFIQRPSQCVPNTKRTSS